jgi:hypothetical protein
MISLFVVHLALETESDLQLELDLPSQWLWDIIDEFIYQFQSFCQYRSKLKNKSEEELALLKVSPDVRSPSPFLLLLLLLP